LDDPVKRFAFEAVGVEELGDGSASSAELRQCDWVGCDDEGAHPAPKSRERLQDRYWFCKLHAREYNRAWNYFAGMSAEEIEQERKRDTIWQRPTWPFSRGDNLGGTAANAHPRNARSQRKPGREPVGAAECLAASTLGLSTPYTMASLKACYRSRAKAAHPDLNPDDPNAEERFKELREAYMTLLRPLST
jgi:hypothetical protein